MKLDTTVTQRDKRLLCLVGCLAFAALFYSLILRPSLATHSQVAAAHRAARERQQTMQSEIDRAPDSAAAMEAARTARQQAFQGLLPKMSDAELDALVTGLILDRELEPRSLVISAPEAPNLLPYAPGQADSEPLPDPPADSLLYMQRITFTAAGSRDACAGLLDDLTRQRPAALLCGVRWSESDEPDSERDEAAVQMQCDLIFYFYDAEALAE